MTRKEFYQAAAAEVAEGKIDQALWIKVTAENPNSNDLTRQALYIRLRAGEMSAAVTQSRFFRFAPTKWWQWMLYLPVSFLVATVIVEGVFGSNSPVFGFGLWFVLLAVPTVIALLRARETA